MNCDQAFDYLTDPEPLQRTHPDLLAHLQHCTRCRQMRQVLAPALDTLLDPAKSSEGTESGREGQPSVTLKGPAINADWLGLPPDRDSVRAARRAARHLMPGTAASVESRIWVKTLRYAAVFLLGILLATAFSGTASETDTVAAGMGPLSATGCYWRHPELAPDGGPEARSQIVLSCVACHLERGLR